MKRIYNPLAEARKRGYKKGYEEGYKIGYEKGYEEGFKIGMMEVRKKVLSLRRRLHLFSRYLYQE